MPISGRDASLGAIYKIVAGQGAGVVVHIIEPNKGKVLRGPARGTSREIGSGHLLELIAETDRVLRMVGLELHEIDPMLEDLDKAEISLLTDLDPRSSLAGLIGLVQSRQFSHPIEPPPAPAAPPVEEITVKDIEGPTSPLLWKPTDEEDLLGIQNILTMWDRQMPIVQYLKSWGLDAGRAGDTDTDHWIFAWELPDVSAYNARLHESVREIGRQWHTLYGLCQDGVVVWRLLTGGPVGGKTVIDMLVPAGMAWKEPAPAPRPEDDEVPNKASQDEPATVSDVSESNDSGLSQIGDAPIQEEPVKTRAPRKRVPSETVEQELQSWVSAQYPGHPEWYATILELHHATWRKCGPIITGVQSVELLDAMIAWETREGLPEEKRRESIIERLKSRARAIGIQPELPIKADHPASTPPVETASSASDVHADEIVAAAAGPLDLYERLAQGDVSEVHTANDDRRLFKAFKGTLIASNPAAQSAINDRMGQMMKCGCYLDVNKPMRGYFAWRVWHMQPDEVREEIAGAGLEDIQSALAHGETHGASFGIRELLVERQGPLNRALEGDDDDDGWDQDPAGLTRVGPTPTIEEAMRVFVTEATPAELDTAIREEGMDPAQLEQEGRDALRIAFKNVEELKEVLADEWDRASGSDSSVQTTVVDGQAVSEHTVPSVRDPLYWATSGSSVWRYGIGTPCVLCTSLIQHNEHFHMAGSGEQKERAHASCVRDLALEASKRDAEQLREHAAPSTVASAEVSTEDPVVVLQARLQGSEQRVLELIGQYNDMSDLLDFRRTKIEQLELKLAQEQMNSSRAYKTIGEMSDDVNELRQSKGSFESAYREAFAETEKLKQKIKAFEEGWEVMQSSINSLHERNGELESSLREVAAENKKLKEDSTTFSRENVEWLEQAIQDYKQEVAALERDKADLVGLLAEQRDMNASMAKERSNFTPQYVSPSYALAYVQIVATPDNQREDLWYTIPGERPQLLGSSDSEHLRELAQKKRQEMMLIQRPDILLQRFAALGADLLMVVEALRKKNIPVKFRMEMGGDS